MRDPLLVLEGVAEPVHESVVIRKLSSGETAFLVAVDRFRKAEGERLQLPRDGADEIESFGVRWRIEIFARLDWRTERSAERSDV